jgi:ABC-type amino acid transport substrate-binding protein
MPKMISQLLLLVVLVSALTACSGPTAATTPAAVLTSSPTSSSASATLSPDQARDADLARILNGKIIVAVYRNQDLVGYQQHLEKTYRAYIPDFKINKFVLADGLTDALLQLNSGKADVMEVMDFTGAYLSQRNPNLNLFIYGRSHSTVHMLFSQSKQAQYEKVNQALKAMQNDGTTAKLVGRWITQLPSGEEPSGGSMPVMAGAETIKMGISGDEPPLDYVAADGQPGGFNVAVLKEVSQRSGINIELLSVTGSGRFAALESGKIDAFLWHNAFVWKNNPAPTATIILGQQKLSITEPYLEASGSYLYKK